MKKTVIFVCCLAFVLCSCVCAFATETQKVYPYTFAFEEFWYAEASAKLEGSLECKSALLMEPQSGAILFAQNENQKLPIASVTKIMTTLLIMEALESGKLKLNDTVTAGENAAKMGGSQIFLEAGEQLSVTDMLKSVIVASANDATVAMAEHLAGTEEAFVSQMNKRAKELGMENTLFANCHGLNEDNHYSTALDVAIMTRELLKHKMVLEYTTIWMDTVRDGKFGLANTNKLIRFYNGANGMKTGYTDVAKYCVSATACRENTTFIAVVIGAETSEKRFSAAKQLLDFGFANYKVITPEALEITPITVTGGRQNQLALYYYPPAILTEKGTNPPECRFELPESVSAPVNEGDVVGKAVYYSGDAVVGESCIYAKETVEKLGFWSTLVLIFENLLGK